MLKPCQIIGRIARGCDGRTVLDRHRALCIACDTAFELGREVNMGQVRISSPVKMPYQHWNSYPGRTAWGKGPLSTFCPKVQPALKHIPSCLSSGPSLIDTPQPHTHTHTHLSQFGPNLFNSILLHRQNLHRASRIWIARLQRTINFLRRLHAILQTCCSSTIYQLRHDQASYCHALKRNTVISTPSLPLREGAR